METSTKGMERKGSLTVSFAIILIMVVAAIFVLGGLFFFKTARLWLVGLGLMVGSIIIVVKAKNNKGVTRFAYVLLFSGLILFLSAGFGFLQTFGGQTTWSIDSVQVQGQNRLIVTASVGVGADTMIIDFSQEELNNALSGTGYGVEEGVNGVITLEDYHKSWNIVKQQNENFFSLGITDTGDIPLTWIPGPNLGFQTGINECLSRGVVNPIDWFLEPSTGTFDRPDLRCVHQPPAAIATRAILGQEDNDFRLNVNIAGASGTITKDSPTLSLHGGDFYVELIGGLTAPQQVPQPQYNVLFANSQFGPLISTASNNFVQSSACTATGNCATKTQTAACTSNLVRYQTTQFNQWVGCYGNQPNGYLTLLNSALQSRNNEYTSGNNYVQSIEFQSTGSNTGLLKVNTIPTSYPVIRMVIDAESIGLHILQGNPELSQCGDLEVNSGTVEMEQITLRNVGNQAGQFSITSSCSSAYAQISPPNIFLNAGQTTQVSVAISGTSTNGATVGSCTITASSTSPGGSNTDTCNIGVTVNEVETLCSPNTIICSEDGSQVLRCGANGESTSVISTCETGTTCGINFQTQENSCVDPGSNTGTGTPTTGGQTGTPTNTITRTQCESKANGALGSILGYTYVESQRTECGFFCTLGIGEPKIVTTNKCSAENFPFIVLGIVGLAGVITIVLAFRKPNRRRRK